MVSITANKKELTGIRGLYSHTLFFVLIHKNFFFEFCLDCFWTRQSEWWVSILFLQFLKDKLKMKQACFNSLALRFFTSAGSCRLHLRHCWNFRLHLQLSKIENLPVLLGWFSWSSWGGDLWSVNHLPPPYAPPESMKHVRFFNFWPLRDGFLKLYFIRGCSSK